jgi:hypothetical protein
MLLGLICDDARNEYGVSDDVKTSNRKRIAMAIDTINQFTSDDKQQIFQYIQSYCEDVPVDGDTFLVSTENHLKKILYGIEQRYYTTPIGNEKRLANSILTLETLTPSNHTEVPDHE